MGDTTKIQWTDHTFNPWIGCAKIDPACKNCYAAVDTFARVSRGKGVELWGVNAERHRTSADNWKKPATWNRAATKAGVRSRVFCASLADVFEDRADLDPWRRDLWAIIRATPSLDWQLLTKRPENIARCLPADWGDGYPNVWLGTTAGDQAGADKRLPVLAQVPAVVRFVSYEPALESVEWAAHFAARKFHWLIVGAESGPIHRPMDEAWVRVARDQCAAAGVEFFYKQTVTSSGHKIGLPLLDGKQHVEFPK
jgi:protein gp37